MVVRGEDGQVIEAQAWRTAKTFDLLRVLALADGRPVAIDVLVDLFWPTAEELRGRASLRTAACQIRKVLGRESVVRVGNGLALLGVKVDTTAYRAVAARVEDIRHEEHPAGVVDLIRTAESLYESDIEVGGSDCPIIHEARSELRELRVHLLLQAADAAGRCRDWRQSLEFAQRAAEIETSDRCTRALMRAWFAVGETAKPVEEFERLRHHLADEYGVDPAPETRALYLQLVSSCQEWPPKKLTIGRESQVQQVMSAVSCWLMDPDGPQGVVWLAGESGSGRDTIAREAARLLMLPLCEGSVDSEPDVVLELLPDQGPLTRGLAASMHSRASAWGRVLIVPVSSVPDDVINSRDVLVQVPALRRDDFRSVLSLVLQGRPTPWLEEELLAESRGLPGLGARRARRRIESGRLSWTSQGVDSTRRSMVRTKILPAMAMLPLACLDLLGGAVSETSPRAQQETAHVAAAWSVAPA